MLFSLQGEYLRFAYIGVSIRYGELVHNRQTSLFFCFFIFLFFFFFFDDYVVHIMPNSVLLCRILCESIMPFQLIFYLIVYFSILNVSDIDDKNLFSSSIS